MTFDDRVLCCGLALAFIVFGLLIKLCIELKKAKAKARKLGTQMNTQFENMALLQKDNKDLEKEVNEFREQLETAMKSGEILENEIDIYADREKQLVWKLKEALVKFEKLRIENSVSAQLKDKKIANSEEKIEKMENLERERTETIIRMKSLLKTVQDECKMIREYVDESKKAEVTPIPLSSR